MNVIIKFNTNIFYSFANIQTYSPEYLNGYHTKIEVNHCKITCTNNIMFYPIKTPINFRLIHFYRIRFAKIVCWPKEKWETHKMKHKMKQQKPAFIQRWILSLNSILWISSSIHFDSVTICFEWIYRISHVFVSHRLWLWIQFSL